MQVNCGSGVFSFGKRRRRSVQMFNATDNDYDSMEDENDNDNWHETTIEFQADLLELTPEDNRTPEQTYDI